jgi:hypothetical protein
MKPQNFPLLIKTILLRMLLYAAIFSLFAFWEPIKQVAFNEPAHWAESIAKAKPFIIITIVFSILFGYRDYYKNQKQTEQETKL